MPIPRFIQPYPLSGYYEGDVTSESGQIFDGYGPVGTQRRLDPWKMFSNDPDPGIDATGLMKPEVIKVSQQGKPTIPYYTLADGPPAPAAQDDLVAPAPTAPLRQIGNDTSMLTGSAPSTGGDARVKLSPKDPLSITDLVDRDDQWSQMFSKEGRPLKLIPVEYDPFNEPPLNMKSPPKSRNLMLDAWEVLKAGGRGINAIAESTPLAAAARAVDEKFGITGKDYATERAEQEKKTKEENDLRNMQPTKTLLTSYMEALGGFNLPKDADKAVRSLEGDDGITTFFDKDNNRIFAARKVWADDPAKKKAYEDAQSRFEVAQEKLVGMDAAIPGYKAARTELAKAQTEMDKTKLAYENDAKQVFYDKDGKRIELTPRPFAAPITVNPNTGRAEFNMPGAFDIMNSPGIQKRAAQGAAAAVTAAAKTGTGGGAGAGSKIVADVAPLATKSGQALVEALPAKVQQLTNEVPGFKAVVMHMEPDEIERVRKSSAQKIVETFKSIPSPDEMASVAYSARAKKGWYKNSAKAIVDTFGADDSPRVAALIAATSPQVGIEQNTINALNIWKNWVAAGRPTDRSAIIEIMGRSVQGAREGESVLPAWVNNTVRALTHESPNDLVLSGPKVNAFHKNLRGSVRDVTLDTWMANYANVPADFFKGTGKDILGKGPRYTGFAAAVRKASDVLSERTGTKWTPEEIQETVWSWAKALKEKADSIGTDDAARKLLRAGGLTHDDIAGVPDFELLFVQGVYRRILEEAGYGKQVEDLHRGIGGRSGWGAAGDAAGGDVRAAEGAGIARSAFERDLDRAAGRLDALRAEQRAGSADRGAAGGAEQPGAPAVSSRSSSAADERVNERIRLAEENREERVATLLDQGLPQHVAEPVSHAEIEALRGAGKYEPAQGLPVQHQPLGDGRYVVPHPIARSVEAAQSYAKRAGIDYLPPKVFTPVDVPRAKRIAKAFEEMKHAPDDPAVKRAYDAMIRETVDQWNEIKKTGLKIDFIKPDMPDPYHFTPRLAHVDVRDNNHLWVFPTDQGFGSAFGADLVKHPLMQPTSVVINGRRLLANDLFRIVHDYFGHIKDGNGFRAAGEEFAWRSHAAMYSPEARKAVTTETRGQNSWLNYGPYGDKNRTAKTGDTIFAEQKVGILPDWAIEEGRLDPGVLRAQQGTGGGAGAAAKNAPPFFSAVDRALETIPMKSAPAEQWAATLKNAKGVKPEELEWRGVNDFLAERKGKPVTREEIAEHLRQNEVQLKDVQHGGTWAERDALVPHYNEARREQADANATLRAAVENGLSEKQVEAARQQKITADKKVDDLKGEIDRLTTPSAKFREYQIPGGGDNYREILITLPQKMEPSGRFVVTDGDGYNMAFNTRSEANNNAHWAQRSSLKQIEVKPEMRPSSENYKSDHWDEPNPLAHIRTDDRMIDDKKTLFMHEVQSDWHQKGRRDGYKTTNKRMSGRVEPQAEDSWKVVWEDGSFSGGYSREYADEVAAAGKPINITGVPDAPFKKSWPELTLKRMIREAAEKGYEQLAWAPGRAVAEMFDLRKHLRSLSATKTKDGTYHLDGVDADTEKYIGIATEIPESKLADHVGKELAEKISKQGIGRQTYQDNDLHVGGSGMNGFYDKILVDAANKLGKPFGARVSASTDPLNYRDGMSGDIAMSSISPEMRKKLGVPERDHDRHAYFKNLSSEDREALMQEGWKANSGKYHVLQITPELREMALSQGFPMFARSGAGGAAGAAEKKYETKLDQRDELEFQDWKAMHAPDDSGEDYDLRGAFRDGLVPGPDGHWPDTYKKPNHPTFSDESIYYDDAPDLAGKWDGDRFIPPKGRDDATARRRFIPVDHDPFVAGRPKLIPVEHNPFGGP